MFLEIYSLDSSRSANMMVSPESFDNFYHLLDESGENQIDREEFQKVFEVYELYKYECNKSGFINAQTHESVVAVQKDCKSRFRRAMDSVPYEFAVNILSLLNVVSLLIRDLHSDDGGTEFIDAWIFYQIVINTFFFLEMITEWVVFGFFYAYKNSFRCWTETLSQCFNIAAIVYLIDGQESINDIVKLFEVVIFIRLLRILSLLYELKTFRIIIETIMNLLGPFYSLLLVQFTIFYAFGLLGIAMYGGKIAINSPQVAHDQSVPDTYYLDNFNDLGASFVTLFALMVVNNWYVIVQMYVDITGTKYTRLFFIAFYYLCVVIGLNIVIAFAIDMYSSIERLEDQQEEHEKKLWEIAQDVKRKKREN